MSKVIAHIYGPFAIHSFGLMISLGLLLFLFFTLRHPRRKALMSAQAFTDAALIGVITALVGGRLLAILPDIYKLSFSEMINIWDGGFSILGSVIGVLGGLGGYLRYQKIPVLPFFDLVVIYVPLLQSISRIGCFLAGCCFGSPTNLPWAVTYQEQDSLAPLCMALHPSQLYSAALLMIIFGIMHYLARRPSKPGQLLGSYLILISAERFIIDFFRGDREFFSLEALDILSMHQWIALGLLGCGFLLIIWPRRQST